MLPLLAALGDAVSLAWVHWNKGKGCLTSGGFFLQAAVDRIFLQGVELERQREWCVVCVCAHVCVCKCTCAHIVHVET